MAALDREGLLVQPRTVKSAQAAWMRTWSWRCVGLASRRVAEAPADGCVWSCRRRGRGKEQGMGVDGGTDFTLATSFPAPGPLANPGPR